MTPQSPMSNGAHNGPPSNPTVHHQNDQVHYRTGGQQNLGAMAALVEDFAAEQISTTITSNDLATATQTTVQQVVVTQQQDGAGKTNSGLDFDDINLFEEFLAASSNNNNNNANNSNNNQQLNQQSTNNTDSDDFFGIFDP